MSVHNKIRVMREIRQWSQEEMAEKMNMSLNGYAKIERGETKLNLEKLEQIANIFNMDAIEFLDSSNKGVFFLMNENGDNNNNTNYYGNNETAEIENERLRLELKYKDEIIQQKNNEIELLRKLLNLSEKAE